MMAMMEDVKEMELVARDRGVPSLLQPAFLCLQWQARGPTTWHLPRNDWCPHTEGRRGRGAGFKHD